MISESQNRDELLIAYLLGELNEQEAVEVSMWIAESDENLRHFEQVSAVWNQKQILKNSDFNSENAWKNVQPKIQTTPFYQSSWFRVAAAVIIILGVVNLIFNSNPTPKTSVLYSETVIVKEQLIDGSNLTINKGSKITYTDDFNTETRTVKLEGEAFFDIERDTTKPFIIELDQSVVKVLGTSFNIKSEPEDELVSVYVKSGIVLFEYLSNTDDSTYLSIKLHAGDKVVYNKSSKKLVPMTNSSSTVMDMYWIDQELIFDGIELGKVADILETVYEVEIEFESPNSKNCLLTVNFQNATIDQIMLVIASTFELELSQENNTYKLSGGSCEEI